LIDGNDSIIDINISSNNIYCNYSFFLTVTISALAQAKNNMNESINNSGILPNQTTQNMTQTANQTDKQVQRSQSN
jgi:hypothetical protein